MNEPSTNVKKPRRRVRIPIMAALLISFAGTTFFGVGMALWLGFETATQNTFRLIYDQAEEGIDSLSQTILDRALGLERRAAWVANEVASGAIDPENEEDWRKFLRALFSGQPEVAAFARIDDNFIATGIFPETFQEFQVSVAHQFSLVEEINNVTEESSSDWTPPLWNQVIGEPFFVLKQPLWHDGLFKGMFMQVMSVSDVSRELLEQQASEDFIFTPFALYHRDQVLAHPSLAMLGDRSVRHEELPMEAFMVVDTETLPELYQVDDLILQNIWNARGTAVEAIALNDANLGNITDLPPDTLRVRRTDTEDGNTHHIAYKFVQWPGPALLVVGAHYDASILNEVLWVLIENAAYGIGVLVISVGIAVIGARHLGQRARANAIAAELVGRGDLDNVPPMPPSSLKELDDLGRTFNGMVQGLRERTRIRELFGRYVPDAVAQKLISTGKDELEAETVTATVSFTDLEGFTSLSEELGPEAIVELLNEYFEVVAEVIERNGGVITQFQGDAVLAIYNAPVELPDHEMAAVTAAREIFEAVVCRTFAGRSIRCRTGITTGELVSGSVGAPQRRTYTVHGDVVNTAARLEAMNKELKTRILLGPVTAAAVRDRVELEPQGSLDIRGRSEALPVFSIPVNEPPREDTSGPESLHRPSDTGATVT